MRAPDIVVVNERLIYGHLLPMVQFIRSKGWVVFKEGHYFRVGTMPRGSEQRIIDVYNREVERENRQRAAQEVVPKGPGKTKARKNRKARLPARPAGGGSRKGGGKKASRSRVRPPA